MGQVLRYFMIFTKKYLRFSKYLAGHVPYLWEPQLQLLVIGEPQIQVFVPGELLAQFDGVSAAWHPATTWIGGTQLRLYKIKPDKNTILEMLV